MRILIAEDDYASKVFMQRFLRSYGECDLASDGFEAVDAYLTALKEEKPYNLICLDIMMPKLDGLKVLKAIRDIEIERKLQENEKAKIIMTTALNDKESVMKAYEIGCEAYAWKPIETDKFVEVMKKLELIK